MSTLASLISPVTLEEFRQDHWERAPLHVPGGDSGRFTDLLSLADVGDLLSRTGSDLENIRVVIEGRETPVRELSANRGRNGTANAVEELYNRYRNGSTIVLNALERRWGPLGTFAADLGAEVNARFQANVYLTPGGESRGFNPHYDTHDVFVLQVHGVKRWRLYGSPYELPLRSRPYDHSQEAPAPEREIEMNPGDVLYLPRGAIHAATSADTASLHITMGVHPVLWAQVLQDAIGRLASEDVRFRSGLPLGFANDKELRAQAADTVAGLVDVLAARLAPQELVEEAAKRAVSISPATLQHHLTDLEAVSALGLTTSVRRRPGLRWSADYGDEGVELEFHNKTVRLPGHVADEVRCIAEAGGPFTAESIVGDLDTAGRLVLVQALVREGFLTLA
ncbi:cupin domain-containing protein [Streptomyces sp. NPDC004284]|uniref:cupin domain-containing protein n=1 Tax=Streptomyces sp. NPDC004284 TaxID=3364695 RepID=UPI00367E4057